MDKLTKESVNDQKSCQRHSVQASAPTRMYVDRIDEYIKKLCHFTIHFTLYKHEISDNLVVLFALPVLGYQPISHCVYQPILEQQVTFEGSITK